MRRLAVFPRRPSLRLRPSVRGPSAEATISEEEPTEAEGGTGRTGEGGRRAAHRNPFLIRTPETREGGARCTMYVRPV